VEVRKRNNSRRGPLAPRLWVALKKKEVDPKEKKKKRKGQRLIVARPCGKLIQRKDSGERKGERTEKSGGDFCKERKKPAQASLKKAFAPENAGRKKTRRLFGEQEKKKRFGEKKKRGERRGLEKKRKCALP